MSRVWFTKTRDYVANVYPP